ncbi:MAG: TonB-dependent receptor, partial [Acidobacteriota bacterium]|nr:TonB-dependent receptor [Acidobacteriota bacterium]
AVDDIYTFSSTLVGNVRYSWSRLSNVREPRSFGFDLAQLGFPAQLGTQIGLPAIPAVTVTGMGGSYSQQNVGIGALFGLSDLIRFGLDTHSAQGNLTKIINRHTIKTGVDVRMYRFNTLQQPDTGNSFSFTPAFTQGPDPTRASQAAGYGFASFLLGTGGGAVQIVPALALQQVYYGVFVQDDYKVTPRLTLNLGLRYDYEAPRTDRFNQLTQFDYEAAVPLQVPGMNLRGALQFPGTNNRSRYHYKPDRNNFAPRFGFAYQLTSKTVVRGGGGIFYAPTTGVGGAATNFGASGFQAVTTFVGSLDGVTPTRFLNNPYPDGINQPTGSTLGTRTLLGQGILFADQNSVTPYAVQWNLNGQRALPGGVLFEVGYVGSRGVHLQADLILNQLPEQALRLGNSLRDLVPNPFFGLITTGPLAASTVSRAQLLRPYPHFDQVTAVNSTWGSSTYHGLLTKFEKRLRRGFNFIASYSFTKLIDDVGSAFGGESLGATGVQNYYDRRAERAISSLDAPHRLVLSYTYELPFGAGKRFLTSGVAGKLLGGWRLNGITTFQSGVPLGVTTATNNTFAQGGGQRPNLLRDPRLPSDERTITRWFDTTAFTQPEPFTYGNAPRTIPGLRSDGENNTDFSIIKRTTFKERYNIEFRTEAFNVFNTPRFNPPNLAFGNPNFGTISAQANNPRIIQFGIKLAY